VGKPVTIENHPGVVMLPKPTIRVVAETIEGGDARGRWRWTLSSDTPLVPDDSDGWTILLKPSRSSDRRSKAWQLDLAVATTEGPNGLMDVVIERSLRSIEDKDRRGEAWSTPIRALQAPLDRTVTVLADGEKAPVETVTLPLARLNLKASDGASLTREVVLRIDR
jgi:hypothetical protein